MGTSGQACATDFSRREDGQLRLSWTAYGTSALSDGFRWHASLDLVRTAQGIVSGRVQLTVPKSNYTPDRREPLHLVREEDFLGCLRPATAKELAEDAAATTDAMVAAAKGKTKSGSAGTTRKAPASEDDVL